jgi:hypothetical protein
MAQYGITKTGFVIKPFQDILNEKAQRAREMFGDDIDLRSTSALRKILEINAFEDQELWKGMEQLYYSNFISTASGDALDLLGEDLGVTRRFLPARGVVAFTLSGEIPGRLYHLPIGTIVQTAEAVKPTQFFRTLETVSLSSQNKTDSVEVEAIARGPLGDIGPRTITGIEPSYAQRYLSLGTALVAAANVAPFEGGDLLEDDVSYRDRLLGYPRALWTLERVERAVREVDGVLDCLVFDPQGGVDIARSYFQVFQYNDSGASSERRLGSPYYFDVVVATYPGMPWQTVGNITGVYDRVMEAIREVRPVSIFPNVVPANLVEVGVRATLKVVPGSSKDVILGNFVSEMRRQISGLRLGSDVLYADVLCLAKMIPGVLDVQGLRLRRCPSLFGQINFGGGLFRNTPEEAAVGENLNLAPDEIAIFNSDSTLIDIQVSDISDRSR